MCGIYKITNQINKKVYIGQSRNIKERWKNHRVRSNNFTEEDKSTSLLYRAIKKYGISNFTFEVVEECSINQLDEKEKYYIKFFNSYGENGYNLTEGGQGVQNCVVKLSKEDILDIYNLLLFSDISQKDIAQLYQVGQDTISEINQGKTRIQEGYSFPLRLNINNPQTMKYCLDCGVKIEKYSTRCSACEAKRKRKVTRPSRDELKKLIRTKSFVEIAKMFGVTDNSIRKWCIAENLPSKKREIQLLSNEDWENI